MTQGKIKGLTGTILVHVLFLFLLFILGFSAPDRIPEEQGIEVNLGYMDQGMGDIQEELPESAEESPAVTPSPDEEKEEVSTQLTEEAPVEKKPEKVVKKTEEKPVNKPEVKKEVVPEEPKVNPNALYKGKSKGTGEGGNQGITGQPGDQGVPEGVPGADNYSGTSGPGQSVSFDLKGRNPMILPKPSNKFSESGTVVVQITVDKYGKVIKAVAIEKGSTTTDPTLRSLATEAAYKAKFNAKPDGPEEQKGTITYHFIVRN